MFLPSLGTPLTKLQISGNHKPTRRCSWAEAAYRQLMDLDAKCHATDHRGSWTEAAVLHTAQILT
eukprot:350843-Chlamydomonas_euryale.AAC.6